MNSSLSLSRILKLVLENSNCRLTVLSNLDWWSWRKDMTNRASSSAPQNPKDLIITLSLQCPTSPASSVLSLTPGRARNIDQDMEAIRISRQDNPFLQQIIASRESLVDCVDDESDNTNLMSQDFADDLEVDPLSLPEIHEHMIRSPPPINWPRSQHSRMFQFPEEIESSKPSDTVSNADRSNREENASPFRSRNFQDRLSILSPIPKRSFSESRRSQYSEDSVQLMSGDE